MSKFSDTTKNKIEYFATRRTIYLQYNNDVVRVKAIQVGKSNVGLKYLDTKQYETVSFKRLIQYGWKSEATQRGLKTVYDSVPRQQASQSQSQSQAAPAQAAAPAQHTKKKMVVPEFLNRFKGNKLYGNDIYRASFGDGVELKVFMERNNDELINYIGKNSLNPQRSIFYIIYWALSRAPDILNHKFGVGNTSRELMRHSARGANYIISGANRVPLKVFCNHLIIFNDRHRLTINGRPRKKNECLETVFKYIVLGSKGKSSNFTGFNVNNNDITTSEHFNLPNKAIDMIMKKISGITLTARSFKPFKLMVEKKYTQESVLDLLFDNEAERTTFLSLISNLRQPSLLRASQMLLSKYITPPPPPLPIIPETTTIEPPTPPSQPQTPPPQTPPPTPQSPSFTYTPPQSQSSQDFTPDPSTDETQDETQDITQDETQDTTQDTTLDESDVSQELLFTPQPPRLVVRNPEPNVIVIEDSGSDDSISAEMDAIFERYRQRPPKRPRKQRSDRGKTRGRYNTQAQAQQPAQTDWGGWIKRKKKKPTSRFAFRR